MTPYGEYSIEAVLRNIGPVGTCLVFNAFGAFLRTQRVSVTIAVPSNIASFSGLPHSAAADRDSSPNAAASSYWTSLRCSHRCATDSAPHDSCSLRAASTVDW